MSFHGAMSRLSYGIAQYRDAYRPLALAEVQKCLGHIFTETTPLEAMEIYQAVRSVEHIPGSMAEVGVYRGGSAAVLLSASAEKKLHLFDTFAGLPHAEHRFRPGQFAGSLPDVRRNLERFQGRIEFHEGYFPDETCHDVENEVFSFVHLDMDLYPGTLGALNFFWPRIAEGGILISHDYPRLEGVVRAFTEFFAGKVTPVIPLSGVQCLVVKISE